MRIDFSNNKEFEELQEVFNQLDPEEAIFMNHYELARQTGIHAERWKTFLLNAQVSSWMEQEIVMFTEFQLKQMIRDSTDDKRSVAAPQMINSLKKTLEEGRTKEGPIIIYTFVPLTEEQKLGTPVQHIELTTNVLAALPAEWEE